MTPLLVAARQGHVKIVREILHHCPNCREKVNKGGWNVAHFLVVRRVGISLVTKNPLVRDLIDEKDSLGITPRQLASPFFNMVHVQQQVRLKEALIDVFNAKVAETRVRWLLGINTPYGFSESKIDKAVESHLVVATLVATVAFAAGITVPDGHRSESGPQHKQAAGTPFLLHSTAFQAFVISDTMALVLSLYAIFTFFRMRHFSLPNSKQIFVNAGTSLGYALVALAISFSTAFYVVLKPAPLLAFTSCFIGLCFFVYASA